MPMRLLLLCLAVTVCAGEPLPGAIVLAQRGAAFTGAAQVQGKGMSVGGTVLAWGDVAAASFPVRIIDMLDGGVVTVDGEVLRGVPRQIDAGHLVFAGDLHGDLRLPLNAVAAVLFAPRRLVDLPALVRADAGAVLANGERVAGSMTFCNAEAIGIDTGRRVAQVPRGRVAAVALRPMRPAQAGRERTWFALATGDRLLVDAVAVAGGAMQVRGPLGTVGIDVGLLAQAWSDGARAQPLTAVPPVRAVALDRIGAALPVAAGAGFPLTVGMIPASDGVVLSARGEIAWKVPFPGTLMLWAGCPDGGSDTAAAIALDGKVVWEQTLRAGSLPVPVTLPLKGATELTLRAAPGPGGETARSAIAWCHPFLVK